MAERDRVRRLAAQLAGDRSVDWDDQEQQAANDEERVAIRQMRVLAAVAGFHQSVRDAYPSDDLAASISMARSMVDSPTSAPRADAPAALPPGTRWGHLEILERVGQGGFGEVYRARDTRLDRIVALKLLATSSTSPHSSDEVVREARLLAKVRHPNVCTVYGADRIDGRVGICMEFLRGETLDRILRTRGTLDAREAALLGIDLCRAVSAVHAAGVVHQDVKLANIIRAEGGRIVLMDFGLGRETEPNRLGDETRTISGTPHFIAPEVLRGSAANARSDVYSLGVVLFALVTGVFPVEATRVSDLQAKHDRGDVRRIREQCPDLPRAFAHVVERALAPDPKERFASPAEVEHALLQTLVTVMQSPAGIAPAPGRRRVVAIQRWAIVTLAIALAAATVLGILAARRAPADAHATRPAPLAELPVATLRGEVPGDMFGLAVLGPGDVDQDGFDDVLIAAPYHAAGGLQRGKIYLYRGTATGVEGQPAWTTAGSTNNDVLGWSLGSAKTILGGFPDLIVGSPGHAGTGCVSRYSVSGQGLSLQAVQNLPGDHRDTLFGYAISTGDVNHDGLDDLLVGEPYFPDMAAQHGRVRLYLGKGHVFDESPIWSAIGPPGSQFGNSVSLNGDVNHDGYADALVGAPKASFGTDLPECGAAYLYLGSAVGLDSVPAVLPGRQAGALFGQDALIAGDLDGDGFADIVSGAEHGTNGQQHEGVMLVYFGSSTGITPYGEVLLEPNTMGANFGGHAGSLGDLDGDGCNDLFVGALRYQRTQAREGAAFVYLGSRTRRFAPAWLRVSGKAGSWYGAAGTSAGDVNGDGFLDFVVAAPSWDTGAGSNVGQVEVFLNTRKR